MPIFTLGVGTRGDLRRQLILRTVVYWGNLEMDRNSQHFGTELLPLIKRECTLLSSPNDAEGGDIPI